MTTTYRHEASRTGRVSAPPRRGDAAALAMGTLLAAVALAMHLRGGVDDVDFVRRVEAAPTVWLVGHVVMAIGGLLLLVGLRAVPALAPGRGRRIVLVGSALAAVGAAATALGDFAHGTLAYVLVDDVPAEQSLAIQEQFFTHPLLAAVTMPGLLLPVGILVLGAGLFRSRAVPVPAALLVLVAPFAVQLGYMATSLPMVLMVVPLVIGLCWVALVAGRGTE